MVCVSGGGVDVGGIGSGMILKIYVVRSREAAGERQARHGESLPLSKQCPRLWQRFERLVWRIEHETQRV